jgi:hypothetical protein
VGERERHLKTRSWGLQERTVGEEKHWAKRKEENEEEKKENITWIGDSFVNLKPIERKEGRRRGSCAKRVPSLLSFPSLSLLPLSFFMGLLLVHFRAILRVEEQNMRNRIHWEKEWVMKTVDDEREKNSGNVSHAPADSGRM